MSESCFLVHMREMHCFGSWCAFQPGDVLLVSPYLDDIQNMKKAALRQLKLSRGVLNLEVSKDALSRLAAFPDGGDH